MPTDRGTLRDVIWQDIFPGVLLFSTVRLAMSFRALLLAAIAMVLTATGWSVVDKVFSSVDLEVESPWRDLPRVTFSPSVPAIPSSRSDAASVPAVVPSIPPVAVAESRSWHEWWFTQPFIKAWREISRPFVRLFDADVNFTRFVGLLLGGVWSLAVWSLFGAAITRIAAVSLAREQAVSWPQVWNHARRKWASYFAAPLLPLAGVLVAAAVLALFGLLLQFGLTALLAGLLWPVALLAGVFMAVLLVGLLFGWPLMWATISAEGTDSFDALSRSYAYSFQRPMHYFFYAALAAVLSIVGWFLVLVFAHAIIDSTNWAVSWGSGNQRLVNLGVYAPRAGEQPTVEYSQIGPMSQGAAWLIGFWTHCVNTLAWAYTYSFFWTASTAIYFLLRRHVDNTEMDEVYMPQEDEVYGLPPLGFDAAGVPGVIDDPAIASGERIEPEG